MRASLLVSVVIVTACGGGGGDDHVFMDAVVVPPPSHDLSCLNHTVATVPDPINLAGVVQDVTNASNVSMVGNAMLHLHRVSDGIEIATATSSAAGIFSLSFASGGTPARNYWDIVPDAADTMRVLTRLYFAEPAVGSNNNISLYMVSPTRLDDIATAQGVVRDAGLGALEVAVDDCSFAGFPGATIAVDGTDTQWAMFAGAGSWLTPQSVTGAHPHGWTPSVAARVNVPPGHHTITITTDTVNAPVTIGPLDIDVVAGAWTWLYVTPGEPL